MEDIERYNNALNENINTLSNIWQEDKQKIKSFIYDEVDRLNFLTPYKALVQAYKYSVQLINEENK
jgi:hypothetical protein